MPRTASRFGTHVVKTTSAGEIQAFNDSGIQAHIDRAINDIPKGKKGAVIGTWSGKVVRGAVVAKLGRNWSVTGVLSHHLGTRKTTKALAVRFAW
jgi:uncharacterized membrane protein